MKKILIFSILFVLIPLKINAEETCDHSYYRMIGSETEYDNQYHCFKKECWNCGDIITDKEKHDFWGSSIYSTYCDDTYHTYEMSCTSCGYTKIIKEKHDLFGLGAKRKATLTRNGSLEYVCSNCNSTIYKQVPWKYNAESSVSYDIISHSTVFKNSKSIKVHIKNPAKGAVLKVKIGKKTYRKKINNNSKTIKIKIKKHPYGKRITINLYYRNKLIGKDKSEDCDDHVLFGRSIKKGMSKKKARYLYGWRDYDRTGSSSGGWSYWYYDDGSYVGFKNGKVKFWYNAE